MSERGAAAPTSGGAAQAGLEWNQRLDALTEREAKRLLATLAANLPEAGRLLGLMLNPEQATFFASVDVLKKRMAKRRGLADWEFEQALETLQREARLLPVARQPEAGLALVELGTLGYEFSHLLDAENAMAVDEGLMLYAEACLALGRGEEALAKLRELEETSNYGLDAREAIEVLTKTR